jgi:hypothetical protein
MRNKMFMFVVMLVAGLFALTSIATAAGWDDKKLQEMKDAKTVKADGKAMISSDFSVQVKRSENGFVMTIQGLKITPDEDTEGKGLLTPTTIGLKSGILVKKKKAEAGQYFFHGESKAGVVTVFIPNYSKAPGEPVIENIWGHGAVGDKGGDLVLNPDDPWVVYDLLPTNKPDMKTLAIGIGMCPNGQVFPEKLTGKKQKEGKYPELASYCEKLGPTAKTAK